MVITASISFQSPKTNSWKKEKPYIPLHLAEYGANIKKNIKTHYLIYL